MRRDFYIGHSRTTEWRKTTTAVNDSQLQNAAPLQGASYHGSNAEQLDVDPDGSQSGVESSDLGKNILQRRSNGKQVLIGAYFEALADLTGKCFYSSIRFFSKAWIKTITRI